MSCPVVYFEIPVSDLSRAVAFYQAVFGCTLELTTIDGNAMALFPEIDGYGVSGALAQGESYTPGMQGSRIYFSCADITSTLMLAVVAGGKLLYPITSIGERGWVAEFEDSEGNCIALHSRTTPSHLAFNA
jgi:hypothetical protein